MEFNYSDIRWFIGRNLPVNDKLYIELEEDLIIECEISNKNWDENNPIYSFLCDYGDGNREIVNISLENILIKYIEWNKSKLNYGYDLDMIIESCIYEKLKLIDVYEGSLEN